MGFRPGLFGGILRHPGESNPWGGAGEVARFREITFMEAVLITHTDDFFN